MAEEHRCQAPRLCVNNCGFFGSPATQNLCSKCHRDLQLKEHQSSTAMLALNQSLVATSSSPSPSPSPSSSSSTTDPVSSAVIVTVNQQGESQAKAKANRCVACRRRVGLTGFECRCGMTFCGSHRYPEQHGCTFDFKGLGREQIARANPIVKAQKLDMI